MVGTSRSLGQWTERAGPVLCEDTLDHVELGIAVRNRRGAGGKVVLKDVGVQLVTVRWREPRPTGWALNVELGEPISARWAETGESPKALGDAPDVGNGFYHIFEMGLQFYIARIRAVRANRALEGRKFLLYIGYKSVEVRAPEGQFLRAHS